MFKYDVTILTDKRYVEYSSSDLYSQNVYTEDDLLKVALEELNLSVHRINWDDKEFDWTSTEYIIFRTTWDYFDRFDEFSIWLEEVCLKTKLINTRELIYWNIDKHYLLDLKDKGIRIPNTIFIEQNDSREFTNIVNQQNWSEYILKPCISGAARHTYRFKKENSSDFNAIFKKLIANESMILQEFQHQIISKGEVAFMVFGGKFSHAVLKMAKKGDYRVQDDFGGSLQNYTPTYEEIEFVEKAITACSPLPVYARVDILWNNENQLCIGEIELVEPELWFRLNDKSADMCANAIKQYIAK